MQLRPSGSGPCRDDRRSIPATRGPFDDLPATGVTAATALGFCLVDRGSFDWDGDPLAPGRSAPATTATPAAAQYISEPLDSGVPGCRWHRVRLDADIPRRDARRVARSARRRAERAPARGADSRRRPAPDDWFEADRGRRRRHDQRAAGPLRATSASGSTGDGFDHAGACTRSASTCRAARASTSFPPIYAEDLDARDFSERFLSLFDAQLEEVDEVVARRTALLDADALPDDALGLARWTARAGLRGGDDDRAAARADRRGAGPLPPPRDALRPAGHPRRSPSGSTRASTSSRRCARGARSARRISARFASSAARVRACGSGAPCSASAPLVSRGNPDDDATPVGPEPDRRDGPARQPARPGRARRA